MAAIPNGLSWTLHSALFAALTAVFAKSGQQQVDADFATLVRTALVRVLLSVFVWAMGNWQPPASLSAVTWGWLLASALATGASWVCYFRALKLGEASKVNAVDKLSLVLVTALALMFLHERLNNREWLGVGLVSAGVLLLVLKAAARGGLRRCAANPPYKRLPRTISRA